MADIEQKLQEIEQERSRLSIAKANLKTAITGKGVAVPDSAKLDEYYLYIQKISIKDNPWNSLSQRIKNGEFSSSNIGETLSIPYTGFQGVESGSFEFEIVSVDTAILADSSNAHNITIMSKNCLFKKAWNTGDGASNRWSISPIRTYLIDEFMPCLDSDFLSIVATVKKQYWVYSGDSEIVTDTIFIPSATELGFGDNNGITEGVQFQKFTDNASRVKTYNGSATEWWTSSASNKYAQAPINVEKNGGKDYEYSSHWDYGVCPCFVLI